MNRLTAALPRWLVSREGIYDDGADIPYSAMNILGNLALCRSKASGVNIALATGLGFPDRALLDQLLQPMACELRHQLIGAVAIE